MTISELLTSAIEAALANPRPSYRIGEISIDHNAYLTALISARNALNKTPDIVEYITISQQK